MKITVRLLNKNDQVKSGAISEDHDPTNYEMTAEDLVAFGTKEMTWEAGDKILVTTDTPDQYLWVQLDETLAPTLIYLRGTSWTYQIPFAENLIPSQLDTSFHSHRHYIVVRKAETFDINRYQNLAFNPHDQYHETGVFPHAHANVETRGESVFFAKNAIDGRLANHSHGSYPFQSWGINQQADATLTVEFGRVVDVDCIKLLFRGDYPHDSFWTQVTFSFSDNSELSFPTEKSLGFQTFKFPNKQVSWVTLKDLKKHDDESPFPALEQIEVYGRNLIG